MKRIPYFLSMVLFSVWTLTYTVLRYTGWQSLIQAKLKIKCHVGLRLQINSAASGPLYKHKRKHTLAQKVHKLMFHVPQKTEIMEQIINENEVCENKLIKELCSSLHFCIKLLHVRISQICFSLWRLCERLTAGTFKSWHERQQNWIQNAFTNPFSTIVSMILWRQCTGFNCHFQ